jgi:hypothetical protein
LLAFLLNPKFVRVRAMERGEPRIPDTDLVCVDPKRVHEIWPYVATLLKKACCRTQLNAFEDIEADILSGRSLLWLAWDGRFVQSAAATVLINSEIGEVCVITVCGGSEMKRWLTLIDQIEAYAKREGCTRVRIYGRKGWLHALDGYRQRYVIIEKQLN